MLENRMPYKVGGEVWVIKGFGQLEKPDPLSKVTEWVEVGESRLSILQVRQGPLFVVVQVGEKPYARVLGIFPSLESAKAFLELQVGS